MRYIEHESPAQLPTLFCICRAVPPFLSVQPPGQLHTLQPRATAPGPAHPAPQEHTRCPASTEHRSDTVACPEALTTPALCTQQGLSRMNARQDPTSPQKARGGCLAEGTDCVKTQECVTPYSKHFPEKLKIHPGSNNVQGREGRYVGEGIES